MEYQKMINFQNNTTHQSSKFRTKNWAEVNDGTHVNYNANSQVKFKTAMLKPNLWDYGYLYILVKWTIAIAGDITDPATQTADKRNKQVTLEFMHYFLTASLK